MKGLFIGLTTIDILYPLDHFPMENEKSRAHGDQMDLGGPAMNAAFAFAALGGEATLVTWIGMHPFTHFMQDKLEHYGINVMDLNPNQRRDPVVSAVIINQKNGSRTIVTSQVKLAINVVAPDLTVDEYDILCIDGFFAEYALDIVKENNRQIPVVLDGGSYKEHTSQFLPWVHYPILSGHFKAPNYPTSISYLQTFALEHFAITNGENAIIYKDKGKIKEIAPPPTLAIDTLGAGDIFHGAFSKFIVENHYDFPSALREAAEIASSSCRFIGARKWTEMV